MNVLSLIDNMPESVYLSLKQAVELGKWENGEVLTENQKQQALQAVMAWQAKHLNSTEHLTIGANGQLIEKSRSELKRNLADNTIIRVSHDDI